MKKLSKLTFTFLFFMLGVSICQAQISGKVMGENDQPLVGATVLVKGTTTGTITDIDGMYSVDANEGDVLIISYIGMVNKEITVGSGPMDINMAEDATTLSDVVVTATRQPIRKIETTTAITNIGQEELRSIQAESFAEALASTPGVTVENSQGRKSNYNIRGFPSGNTYVTSMLDGLPMSGFASRSAGVAEYHGMDANVERIEVVRGSGATLFGRAAGAGAVNVISKTGGEEIDGTVGFTYFNNVVNENSIHDGALDYRADFNVNGPISESLRFNVGGYILEDAGYKNWAVKDKGTQLRANLDYLISDKSSIRIYGMWGNNQFNNLTDVPYDLGTGELADGWTNVDTYYPDNSSLDFESELQTSVFAPAMFSFPILDASGNRITQNQVEDNREEVVGGHIGLSANIQLTEGLTLVQKIRFQQFNWRDQNEISLTSFYNAESSILRLNANSDGNINDIINETRLQYEIDGGSSKHLISGGLYYSNAAYDRFGGLHWYTSNVSPTPTYGWFGPPGTLPPTRFTLSTTTSHQEESVLGLFIGDEMVFNENLRVNVGLRYDRMTGFFNNDPEEVDGIQYDPAELIENELDFSDFSGSIGVNYKLAERSAIYGSFVRAFSLPAVGLATPLPEKNEIVLNTELGYRVGVGDLGVDIALFNTQINNRLATVFDPNAADGQTFVTKPVGTNTVRGAEVQLTYAPQAVKGLLLRGSLTIQQSQYQDFQIRLDEVDHDMDETTPTIPEADINNLFGLDLVTITYPDDPGNTDYAINVAGNQVHNTPTSIITFNAGYSGKSFGAGFDMAHYGGRYVTALNLYEAPNLLVTNANVYGRLGVGDNHIRIGLRIKNLLNGAAPQQLVLGSTSDDILIQKQATPDFTDVLGFGIAQMPRRVLLTVAYDF